MNEYRFIYTVVPTVALRTVIVIIWGLQTGGEGETGCAKVFNVSGTEAILGTTLCSLGT